jgi:glycosyltransferase involved in cell wall biosynthesis
MKILWVTNIMLPEASKIMNEESVPFGGWLVNASKSLSQIENINLSVAFPKKGIKKVNTFSGEKIKYFCFPSFRNNDKNEINENQNLSEILDILKPDLVHIFGTEYAHTLAMVNVCKSKNIQTIISIQGIVSIYAKHYMANIPQYVQKRYTIRDILKQDNIIQQNKKFISRGKFEIEAIKKVNHVIGRTTWDKACTKQINPNIQYHFCNETLREEFYKHSWDINDCEKYSIMISQGSYPIKGLHYMIEAMPLILEKFPNAMLYIGGHDITKSNTFKEKLKISSYGKYIKELIRKNNLQNNVKFTGVLDEREMCERFLKSHVFVCPSSIENSPNSLGEAMILGVPCVASDVGGIADMLKHNEEGYVYQTDAPYMLAHYVSEIFANDELAIKFSWKAREHAQNTHDSESNTKMLVGIYNSLM